MESTKAMLLNLGCGPKYHIDFINVDLHSNSEHVIAANILKPLPFEDGTFDAVYHSQVIEHIPREFVPGLMKECYRVLKKGGVLRIVTPDLESMARNYIKYLDQNLSNPSAESEDCYDYTLLEIFDQIVRTRTGGDLGKFLSRPKIANEEFVYYRSGHLAEQIRNRFLNKEITKNTPKVSFWKKLTRPGMIYRILFKIKFSILGIFMSSEEKEYIRIGRFKMKGEPHYWLYDRYSLTREMSKIGFSETMNVDAETTSIPNWSKYEMDIKKGKIFDPASLFVEGIK